MYIMSTLLFLLNLILLAIQIDVRLAKVKPLDVKIKNRQQQSSVNHIKLREISDNLNTFSFKLHRNLARYVDPKQNFAFSPFSIFTVFSAVCLGADGMTKLEMARSLNWGYDDKLLKLIHPWYMTISKRKKKSAKLFIANKAWVSNDTKLLLGYRKIMKNYFHIKFRKIDTGRPEVSLKTINKWIAKKTRNKIPELFPPGTIDSQTKLVLANALYFKGRWADKFNKEDTERGVFCLSTENDVCDVDAPLDANRVSVAYMRKKASYPMGYVSGVNVLEMPYAGGLLSMYFILPDTNININKLEEKMSSGLLQEMISNLENTSVMVHIPKFKIKHEIELNGNILDMGRLFDPQEADLSFINGVKGLYVSKALHKTLLQVDEAGTVAASATGVHIHGRSGPVEFRLNRPFLFYVIHKECGAIIFSGKVMNPNNK